MATPIRMLLEAIPLFNKTCNGGVFNAHLEVFPNASDLVFTHREVAPGTVRDGFRTVIISAKSSTDAIPRDALCISWNRKLERKTTQFFISGIADQSKPAEIMLQSAYRPDIGQPVHGSPSTVPCSPDSVALKRADLITMRYAGSREGVAMLFSVDFST
ncbi:unnamed protein product [Peniophora sp. CBMAI 1063]|nr:unnamed protein product [Peniophora sp. CBMAI 1063]